MYWIGRSGAVFRVYLRSSKHTQESHLDRSFNSFDKRRRKTTTLLPTANSKLSISKRPRKREFSAKQSQMFLCEKCENIFAMDGSRASIFERGRHP